MCTHIVAIRGCVLSTPNTSRCSAVYFHTLVLPATVCLALSKRFCMRSKLPSTCTPSHTAASAPLLSSRGTAHLHGGFGKGGEGCCGGAGARGEGERGRGRGLLVGRKGTRDEGKRTRKASFRRIGGNRRERGKEHLVDALDPPVALHERRGEELSLWHHHTRSQHRAPRSSLCMTRADIA
eukprot:2129735-Rhodomonas_salina.1